MKNPRYKLIALRKSKNMIQKDVVNLLQTEHYIKITESYYGMIEQGDRTPKLKLALAIAKLYNADPEDIFFDSQPNKKLGNRSA